VKKIKFTEKNIFLLRLYIKLTDFFFTVTNLRFTDNYQKFTEAFEYLDFY
jgi:hypothetical protein